MTDRFAQVALPLPVFAPYTYTIPETLADRVTPGARVVVPVRKRELVGIVVDTVIESEAKQPARVIASAAAVCASEAKQPGFQIRDILAAPDAEPALPAALLRTAEWMAGYYGAPIGMALKAMVPAPMWGAPRVVIARAGAARALGGLAEQLIEWLEGRGGEAPLATAARPFRKPLWEAGDRLAPGRAGAAH